MLYIPKASSHATRVGPTSKRQNKSAYNQSSTNVLILNKIIYSYLLTYERTYLLDNP